MGMGRRGKGGCRGGQRGFIEEWLKMEMVSSLKDGLYPFRAKKRELMSQKFNFDFFFQKGFGYKIGDGTPG